jgi:hypothetical protein
MAMKELRSDQVIVSSWASFSAEIETLASIQNHFVRERIEYPEVVAMVPAAAP